MLIKIVQNGIESDWFQLTKKAHRELIKMKPEAAIIHIEDVYPESPDAGRVIRLDFRLFTVLTREFKLEDLKQEKRDERHVEKLRLEARPANAPELASKTLDEQYIRQEIKDLLEKGVAPNRDENNFPNAGPSVAVPVTPVSDGTEIAVPVAKPAATSVPTVH